MARIIHDSFGAYRARSEGDRGMSWQLLKVPFKKKKNEIVEVEGGAKINNQNK